MINITKKILSQFFGILTILWLIYEILSALNIYTFDKNKPYEYLISIGIIFATIVTINILLNIYDKKSPIDKDFIEHMNDRIGSMKSLDINNDISIDNTHEYLLIHRQDYLDCNEGHYYSVRHLTGINTTNQLSDSLVYSESTEYKISYKDIKIEAYNYKTKEQLVIKSLKDEQKPTSTHIFKIHFHKPIDKNEQFDIVYSIFLPNELKCLNSQDEVMSISLIRIKKKVHNLIFNLCLDFNPTLVKVYSLKDLDNKYKLLKNNTKINKFNISKDEFKQFNFGISWSKEPYIINWSKKNPTDKLYVLQYFK